MFFYDKDNDNGYDQMLFKCALCLFLLANTIKYCKDVKAINATECPKGVSLFESKWPGRARVLPCEGSNSKPPCLPACLQVSFDRIQQIARLTYF